ncbi:MAG TPA: hypothetical protein VHM31_09010 [Polyangia bacterium]|nr:hypothetical protein [Polyangia bacterium]
MKGDPGSSEVELAEAAVMPKVSIGMGWVAALEPRERGALLRLESALNGTLNVEIVLTAAGPVIRASVGALEIEAESDVRVSCNRFLVDARESFAVRAAEISHEARGAVRASGSEVALTARAGEVAIQANDDVRVSGEQVLLNCDREPPIPAWLPHPPPAEATLPAASEHGDTDVLRDLGRK